MISFDEVKVMDMNSKYRGVPPSNLMENAGKALAEEIHKRFPDHKILFYCGTGNNGGDGYVAARYLWKWRNNEGVTVYLIKGGDGVRSKISRENLDKLECHVLEERPSEDYKDHLKVDGILGTGVTGKIREPYRSIINDLDRSGEPVVSIDVPSGLGADISVSPTMTVSFHCLKEGMTKENCGEIVIKDIGVPEKALSHTGPGEMFLYPRPRENSHKGENGKLLIIGGGPYTGAPAIAAMAAYRTGADLVLMAVPSKKADIIAGYSPNFIVHPMEGEIISEGHIKELIKLAKDCDSVLIGPGMGTAKRTAPLVRGFTSCCKKPMVIDADALNVLDGKDMTVRYGAVLTPHSGEFEKLTGMNATSNNTDEYARWKDVTVLLKGKTDYITDGTNKKWNDFGTSAMSVGGTGDTLAGVVGALLSKGLKPFDAGRLGIYITTKAGEIAFKDKGWGLLPEDISDRIPCVLKERR